MRLSQRKLKLSLFKHTNDRKRENSDPTVFKKNSAAVCAAEQNSRIPTSPELGPNASFYKGWQRRKRNVSIACML